MIDEVKQDGDSSLLSMALYILSGCTAMLLRAYTSQVKKSM
jgi:hypothetical protein